MPAGDLRVVLLAIVIELFAVCFALSSTGLGEFTLGFAFVGLLVGIYGALRR